MTVFGKWLLRTLLKRAGTCGEAVCDEKGRRRRCAPPQLCQGGASLGRRCSWCQECLKLLSLLYDINRVSAETGSIRVMADVTANRSFGRLSCSDVGTHTARRRAALTLGLPQRCSRMDDSTRGLAGRVSVTQELRQQVEWSTWDGPSLTTRRTSRLRFVWTRTRRRSWNV